MTPDRLAALAMFAVLMVSLFWLVRWVRQSLSWRPVWDRFRREPLALAGLAFILLLVSVAILAPLLPLRDPNHGYYELLLLNGRPLPPGATFLLGTLPSSRVHGNLLVNAAVNALFCWQAVARIVRPQMLSSKEKEFVEAARALGTPPIRILAK